MADDFDKRFKKFDKMQRLLDGEDASMSMVSADLPLPGVMSKQLADEAFALLAHRTQVRLEDCESAEEVAERVRRAIERPLREENERLQAEVEGLQKQAKAAPRRAAKAPASTASRAELLDFQARLVIEAAQIPGELAASTVQAGPVEILAVIRGQILTRENLLQIASRFAVYADAADLPDDQKAADMVERIVMDLPPSVTPGTSPFVQVSFDAPDPEMSAAVTNLLVDQILEQNTRLRNTVAAQTLEFFQSEVKRLDGELAAQGDKILQFQEAHKDALPTSLDYQRSRQTTLQERLSQQERELSSLRDRRARMVEIFERTGRTDILGENVSPEQRRLQQLKDELASALVIYSPDNPRVIALKARVAALEAANIRAGLGTQDTPNMSVFEFQLADIDGQIAFILEQIGDIETEQDEVKANIEATPGNAIRLGSLERDYENIRQQYSQATAALAEARTGA
ncbi:MAG: hypothetical protein KC613_07990, partial [Myxococcales bacterium]|nr:hypothetical protein [Myxococcales bacterium]